ncbi:hypothetical protein FA140_31065 [Pseudomonas aeruginosa]|nr:hypothetical protein [Pseudomonas aeruginosa]
MGLFSITYILTGSLDLFRGSLVCFLIGLTHILWLIPRERFFYTQEKLLTTKRRKGRKLSMIYPEAFALASPKKLQLSRAFALIMPILQGIVFKMKSLV